MKERKGITYFIREIIIVVIGVLIAVSLNNLKESINNRSYIKKTLVAIEREIKLNQSEIDTVLLRHYAIIDSLEINEPEDDRSLGEMIADYGGIQTPAIRNIGLRFFISNKAELLDFEVISGLLELEMSYDLLSEKMDRLVDFAYKNFNNVDEDVKITFGYMLLDVIDSEHTILETSKLFLDSNKTILNNSNDSD